MNKNPFMGKKNNTELSEEEKRFINNNVDEPIKEDKDEKVFLHFPIDRELKEKIVKYAKSVDRSQNYVMKQALKEWFSEKVE
ncbi:hypothetical protein CFVI97532_07080 [Campylobacter fetus subsp. venerealis cfvi97/532]|nr:hypothetical protein CFVI97532_07080 [Campylobacter fetus subsp. venerealis cfvi97/532]